MSEHIRNTRSVCPVCLKPLTAKITRRSGVVYIEKTCAVHGDFSVPVWRDNVNLKTWRGNLPEPEEVENCPGGCRDCDKHMQGVCCVLLEVTERCNLNCSYCFADTLVSQPDISELKQAIRFIMQGEDKPLLQFSGGEPTLRDDLPELISYARETGCRYTQLNSNGLRLSEDEEYVKALSASGLSFVFMQFDGVTDDVFISLRGMPLLKKKLRAIEMCDKYNIGVTLVPTIVRGINDNQIGDIIKLGASLSPAVRGVHFQPVSYFGRYPKKPEQSDRYTLDELIVSIAAQADIAADSLLPSRCDHPLCGLHGSFIVKDGKLVSLSVKKPEDGVTSAAQNREYIGSRWERDQNCCCCCDNTESLDGLHAALKNFSFTVTAMAFQDAMNLDLERLRRCSLRVYKDSALIPFCARYLTGISQ